MKINLYTIFKICLVIGFYSCVMYFIARGDKDFLNMNFQGRIQFIMMTSRETPKIIVGNKEYLLRIDNNFMKKVKVGDSIIKKKDERHVTVIGEKTKKRIVIEF